MQVQDLLYVLRLKFPTIDAWDVSHINDGCDSIKVKASVDYYIFFNQEFEEFQANYTLMPCYMYGSLELTTESVQHFDTLQELFNYLPKIF